MILINLRELLFGRQSHFDYKELKSYLESTASDHSSDVKLLRQRIKKHLNSCSSCWALWNKVRWDAASKKKGFQELREYLAEDFSLYHDSSWALANEWNSKSRDSKTDIEEFYSNTKNYIYNSLIFHDSGDRDDFESIFLDLKNKFAIQSVTDYGCGVGNDGLMMLENAVSVNFVDFDSPTMGFLKWRLNKRQIPKERFTCLSVLEEIPANYRYPDMLWCIDVIEHMFDPTDIFQHVGSNTKVIVIYTDSADKAGGRHPFHFEYNENMLKEKLEFMGYIKTFFKGRLEIWVKTNKHDMLK